MIPLTTKDCRLISSSDYISWRAYLPFGHNFKVMKWCPEHGICATKTEPRVGKAKPVDTFLKRVKLRVFFCLLLKTLRKAQKRLK